MAEYHEQIAIAITHTQRAIKKYIASHAVELSIEELRGLVGQLEARETDRQYHIGKAAEVAEKVRLQVETSLESEKSGDDE